jgi:hypothetical protein
LPTDLPTIGSAGVIQATPEPSGRTSEHVMAALGPDEQSAPVPRAGAGEGARSLPVMAYQPIDARGFASLRQVRGRCWSLAWAQWVSPWRWASRNLRSRSGAGSRCRVVVGLGVKDGDEGVGLCRCPALGLGDSTQDSRLDR